MRWKGWGDLFWGGDYWIPMDEGNAGWLGGVGEDVCAFSFRTSLERCEGECVYRILLVIWLYNGYVWLLCPRTCYYPWFQELRMIDSESGDSE